MKKPISLLIMAAGLGTRFGTGIKQLAPVDDQGHIIMDYSIHDAIEAGFGKIVFVIRKDIEQDFREVIGERIRAVCSAHGVETAYAFQNLEDIPAGFEVPEGRSKPWGTGQAVLAAREFIDGPFAVINADDYYGKKAFHLLYNYLQEHEGDTDFCMAGFVLKNTLSENGGVTRGICTVDGEGFLTDVQETRHIIKTPTGASADGRVIDPDADVSMNMWGLSRAFMGSLEEGFVDFFRTAFPANPMTAEFLIPIYIGQLVRERRVSVKVLVTEDKWFGVTYREDQQAVTESFRQLIRAGIYQPQLYSDL